MSSYHVLLLPAYSACLPCLPTLPAHPACVQPWSLWWYPILKPGVHYVESTVGNFSTTLKGLLARGDGGRSLADAASEAMRKGANVQVAVHYTYLVMKHLHDLTHSNDMDMRGVDAAANSAKTSGQ